MPTAHDGQNESASWISFRLAATLIMVSAIIVAAGSSRRMGFDKLFASLAGKPVIWHSLKAFSDCKEVDEIVLVAKEDRLPEFQQVVQDEKLSKVHKVVAGGAERHLSVWNGLQVVDSKQSEFVAIHDGARALTTPRLIRDCLAMLALGALGVFLGRFWRWNSWEVATHPVGLASDALRRLSGMALGEAAAFAATFFAFSALIYATLYTITHLHDGNETIDAVRLFDIQREVDASCVGSAPCGCRF